MAAPSRLYGRSRREPFPQKASPRPQHMSGDLIIMVVLGGMGSAFGPLFGAVALLVLEEVLSHFTEYWQIILGPLLLLVVLFARGGIDGLLRSAGRGRP